MSFKSIDHLLRVLRCASLIPPINATVRCASLNSADHEPRLQPLPPALLCNVRRLCHLMSPAHAHAGDTVILVTGVHSPYGLASQ